MIECIGEEGVEGQGLDVDKWRMMGEHGNLPRTLAQMLKSKRKQVKSGKSEGEEETFWREGQVNREQSPGRRIEYPQQLRASGCKTLHKTKQERRKS